MEPNLSERKHTSNPVDCDGSQSEIYLDVAPEPPAASGGVPDPHSGEIQRRSTPGDAIEANGRSKVVSEVSEVSVGQPGRKSVRESYSCNFCGKCHPQKRCLMLHVGKQHAHEIPFASQGKRQDSVSNSNPLPHQKLLLYVTPHMCVICKKSFSCKSKLKRHTSVHTSERPFECPVCAKSFKTKDDVKKHSLVHTNEKNFRCPVCRNSFWRKEDFWSHSLVHTNEKNFRCPVCGNSFWRKEDLWSHSSVHTGENRFHCPECGKSFTRIILLNEHLLIHYNLTYYCDFCNQRFLLPSELEWHLLNEH